MFGKKPKSTSTKDLVLGNSAEDTELDKPPKKKKDKATTPKEKRSLKWKPNKKVLWGILCIVTGLLIGFVGVPMAQKQAAKLTPVVVLTDDVPFGSLLTKDMLTTVEVGINGVPRNAITSMDDAVGRYLTTDGLASDILTEKRLSTQYPTDDPELLDLPDGTIAMAVSLDTLEQSVASKLRAGDVIQLFAVMEDSVNTSADNMSALIIPELRAVEVLSATNSNAVNVDDQNTSSGEDDRQISTVVLAVNQQQAAVLSGLASKAHLHSALVLRGDSVKKEQLLEAQDNYFSSLAVSDTDTSEDTTAPERKQVVS